MNAINFSNKQLEIEVCLGNCCYLKGTNDIIQELKQIIKEKDLFDRVHIKPKTCLDQCENAPVIMINGELITNVKLEDLNNMLRQYLLDNN